MLIHICIYIYLEKICYTQMYIYIYIYTFSYMLHICAEHICGECLFVVNIVLASLHADSACLTMATFNVEYIVVILHT